MKRRKFLLGTTSGLAVVANADHVFARASRKRPFRTAGCADRCLVLINLYGGNDGLNCVVPHGNDRTISCAQRLQSTAKMCWRSTETWGSIRDAIRQGTLR